MRLRVVLRRSARPRGGRSRWKRALVLLSVVGGALAAGGAALVALTQTKPVTLAVDGEAYPVRTQADTVGGLLRELNIQISAHDRVTPPTDAPVYAEMVVRVDRARPVRLHVDGRSQTIWTALSSPTDILHSAGVDFADGDRLLVNEVETRSDDLALWDDPVSSIHLRHAVTIYVEDAGRRRAVQTSAETVGEALFDAGYTLYLGDRVTPNLNTPIASVVDRALNVWIERAVPLTILADGIRTHTRSAGAAVADALSETGVALVGLDYSVPSESAPLRAGMTIRVVRVREETLIQAAALPFATVYRIDASLPAGQRRVIQTGQMGVQRIVTRVRYEDGVIVAQVIEDARVIQQPQDQVIVYGGAPAPGSSSRIIPLEHEMLVQ